MQKIIEIGDYVQWTTGGVDQFLTLRRVVDVSECGEYLFVQGSFTGIPVSQISKVFNFTVGLREFKV